MSSLFGGGETPQPQAAPQSPSVSAEAERQRQAAEAAAAAESKAAGRRSTIVAGMQLAEDGQQGVGLMSQSRRKTARAMVG